MGIETTKRLKEVLALIRYSIEDRGYAPTYREFCLILGVSSKNGVNDFLLRLEELGYIERKRFEERGIFVTADGIDLIESEGDWRSKVLTMVLERLSRIDQSEIFRLAVDRATGPVLK